MDSKTQQTLAVAAAIAWAVVAAYGIWSLVVTDDDGWELTYMLFSIALLVGAVLSVMVAGSSTRDGGKRGPRVAGLVIGGIGCALAIVAWATPVWMTLLGVAFAAIAAGAEPGKRRVVAILALGQLAGVVVLYIALTAELGTRNEHGDYPLAAGLALVVTGAIMVTGLCDLAMSRRTRLTATVDPTAL